MQWTAGDVSRERPVLQALAAFKYDEYQQFSPGMRFVESLALWLAQFSAGADRQCAYELVRSKLVFISAAEMAHLVAGALPDVIRPALLDETAVRSGIPQHRVAKLAASLEYRVALRRTLFLGLSDGARLDVFRRNSPEISHEQVWQVYEIPAGKGADMQEKLAADLAKRLGRTCENGEDRFQTLVLLDDFSGSGLSYFRGNPREGYKGKIYKVLRGLTDVQNPLSAITEQVELRVCVVLYLATEQGLDRLRTAMRDWVAATGSTLRWSVDAMQTIPDSARVDPAADAEMEDLLARHFDPSILDKHYRVGKHDRPHLGFDEGALPLVLPHNTPNNSVPLLWFEQHRAYRGLFPRVSRHREAE